MIYSDIKLSAESLRNQQNSYWSKFSQVAQVNLQLNRAIFRNQPFIDIIFSEPMETKLKQKLTKGTPPEYNDGLGYTIVPLVNKNGIAMKNGYRISWAQEI